MTPQELVDQGKCFACYGASQEGIFELTLLNNVTPLGGGIPAPCTNLSGLDINPTGIVTPAYTGQVYVGADCSVWQSTGTTSADWAGLYPSPCLIILSAAADSYGFNATNYTSIFFPNLTMLTIAVDDGDLITEGNANLVSVSAPLLSLMQGLLLVDTNPVLTSMSFPALVTVGWNMNVSQNDSLATISFPLLATIGGFLEFDNSAALTSVSFPSLTTVNDSIQGAGCPLLTTLNLGALMFVAASVVLSNSLALAAISIPNLWFIGGDLSIDGCSSLVSVSLPALATLAGNVGANDNPALTTWNAPLWNTSDNTSINFINCALTEASIGNIFAAGVAGGVANCVYDVSGGTNASKLGWSVGTTNNYNILIGNGCNIFFNP